MLRKGLIACAFAAMLTAGISFAKDRVYIQTGPPAAVVETRPPAPGAAYVWTPGYYNYNGGSYAWVGGKWVTPPHGHHHYESGRWMHDKNGWYYRDGYWK